MGVYHFLVVLLAGLIIYLQTRKEKLEFTAQLKDSYDYVIVGAGSAGAVLANRLSEDGDTSVLLIEAGGCEKDNPAVAVPMLVDKTIFTEYDWGYYTEPQEFSQFAMKNRKSYWPRGKLLGGSSNLNYMVYMRGSRHDYDGWAELGATGWSYDDVLPYFLKLEDIQIDELKDSAFHNVGGPLKISGVISSPLVGVFKNAVRDLGYGERDCNGDGGNQEGFCHLQSTTFNGVRSSTDMAYLYPVMHRPNLDIAVYTHATKVLFNKKEATGVEFIRNGRKQRALAKREVILSAGAIGSPQILMLSGVGPQEHLRELDIPVIADLPVGENLQDHMVAFPQIDMTGLYSNTPERAAGVWSNLQYTLFGTGPMGVPGLNEAEALFRVDSPDEMPNIQFQLRSTQNRYWEKFFLARLTRDEIRDEVYPSRSDGNRTVEGFTICMLAPHHPKSRGTIRLKSRSPFDYPVIDPRYMEHPDDVKAVVNGYKLMMKLLDTPSFSAIGAHFPDSKRPFSFCKEHAYGSDKYWECVGRHLAVTVYHHTSTCKMGASNDKSAVLDPQLRVRGLSKIRVVDASAMPVVTTANINGPIIMMAEKAADMIRGIDTVAQWREKLRGHAKS
ncbi:hypothetical protein ScPMuIL_003124 [Solemya velum]